MLYVVFDVMMYVGGVLVDGDEVYWNCFVVLLFD